MEAANSISQVESLNYQQYEEEEHEDNSVEQPEVKKSMRPKKQPIYSLTLLNAENGEIKLPPKTANQQPAQPEPVAPKKSSGLFGWLKKKQQPQTKTEPQKSVLLPCPKIINLFDAYYCVYNANVIDLYRYNPTDKSRNSDKKIFQKIDGFTLNSDIIFVKGANNTVLIGMANAVQVLALDVENLKISWRKRQQEVEVVGGTLDGQHIIVITRNKFKKYKVQGGQLKLSEQTPITITVKDIKFIEILKGQRENYFFMFSERKMVRYLAESQIRLSTEDLKEDPKHIERPGEAFHIIDFFPENGKYRCDHYDIAKIPEEGMFNLSKIFYLGSYTFLVSLHEQIVVIRKLYSRFILVDNICVTSDRLTDESKKGQLALIDMQKIIYNENQRIYVYNFTYNRDSDKLKMELVDNFKGVDEAQIILYDGILLKPKDQPIQVLFYFNMRKIRRPGRAISTGPDPTDYDKDEDKLKFSVYGIVQLRPVKKLVELLQLKRPPNEILEFRNRFQISNLEYYKSTWSVSAKSLNDIINHLLEINDQNFIQKELDEVLRKETHTMSFLIQIEEKQKVRLKAALNVQLSLFLQKNAAAKPEDYHLANHNEISQYVIKLLESKMFLKKLKYLNEFQAYKQVDFIDIKKLRETSLKEEIKLLSCKGYERRLKNFLNDFKFLAIANFAQIFDFLMAKKELQEIQTFLFYFNFILPQSKQTSFVSCFIQAQKHISKSSENDECRLWDQLQYRQENETTIAITETKKAIPVEKPQTIDTFTNDVCGPGSSSNDFRKVELLKIVLKSIMDSSWFKDEAFKKHCMLDISEEQLQKEFRQLKKHKVYDILFRFLYEKLHIPAPIKTQNSRRKDQRSSSRKETALAKIQAEVDPIKILNDTIKMLVDVGRVPPSYHANVKVRQHVYKFIERQDKSRLSQKLEDFIILPEPEYFQYLIQMTPFMKSPPDEHFLLSIVKRYYIQIAPDQKFFLENLSIFLNNESTNIETICCLLEEFEKLGPDYHNANSQLLLLLINSLISKLPICSSEVTFHVLQFLNNLYLEESTVKIGFKMAKGYCFSQFFRNFNLDFTYERFIEETKKTENNEFLQEIIDKYVNGEFKEAIVNFKLHVKDLIFQEKSENISQPNKFFRFLTLLQEQADFLISTNSLMEVFLLSMFKNKRYQEVRNMTEELYKLVEDQDPKVFFQELILKHVDKVYESGLAMSRVYEDVRQALDLVDPITINIKRKRAFLQLSLQLTRLQPDILDIFRIKEQLKNKPLVFMMHLLETCGSEYVKQLSNEDAQTMFATIYEKMTEAVCLQTSFKCQALKSNQFLQFQVERGYYCLKKGWLELALDVCCEFKESNNEQTGFYYHDLIYSITCEVIYKNDLDKEASTTLLQYITSNNEYDGIKKVLVSCDKLREILNKDKESQVLTMRDLATEMKNKQTNKESHKMLPLVFQNFPLSVQDILIGAVQTFLNIQNEDQDRKKSTYYMMFVQLLNTNTVQAFYFLMKTREISISGIVPLIDKQINEQNKKFISMYFSLAVYIRSLTTVVDNFYPTFSFFLYKKNQLSDDRTRRDINILVERLRLIEGREGNKIDRISTILMDYYDVYMKELSKQAKVNLTEVQLQQNLDVGDNLQKYSEINKDELRIRKELLSNQSKFDNLVTSVQTRIQLPDMNPPPVVKITPIAELDLGQQMRAPELPSQKYVKYEDIKKKEMEQLAKIQQESMNVVKNDTNNQIQKIIEKYRLQKQEKMLRNPMFDQTKSVRDNRQERAKDDDQRSMYSSRYQPQKAQVPVRLPMKIQRAQKPILRVQAEKPYEDYKKPALMSERQKSIGNIFVAEGAESVASNSINMLKKKIEQNQQRLASSASNKMSMAEIKENLQNNKETEMLTYVSKVEMIKDNLTLALEFIKKMFDSCRSFPLFLKTLDTLVKNYSSLGHLIELKAINVATQAIRLDSKIDPKKLFDIKFFQEPVPDLSIKEFEDVAFKRLKSNLARLLDQQNVHSLAKMMLYGLGLDKKYEHQTYILYLAGRLEDYLLRGGDEKTINLLIQKIKSVFSKLPQDSRSQNIKELILQKSVTNRARAVDLIQKYEQSINRTMKIRTTMVSGEDLELLQALKTTF